MTSKLKKNILKRIDEDQFPTPKKIIWHLKDDGYKLDAEAERFIWTSAQIKLEEMIMIETHPSRIAAIQRYLERNYADWDPNGTGEVQEQVVVNFNLTNTSENKI